MEHAISHKSEIKTICAPVIEKIKTEGYESATLLINEIKNKYQKSDMDTKHGLLNLVDNLVVEGGADFHRALVQSEFLAVISNTQVKKIIKLVLGYLNSWKSKVNPDHKNAFDESIRLLRETFRGILFGLTQSAGAGSMGQFQICPVNPLIPFYTMLYFRAQRLLSLARTSSIFHMLNVHISRQALHLVILLNDLAYTEDGLDSEQMDERIDLEDEFIELESGMKVWGFEENGRVDGDHLDMHLPGIQKWYGRFFKERFYFAAARDPSNDKTFKKLLSYDRRTFGIREAPMVLENLLTGLTGMSIGEGTSKPEETKSPLDKHFDTLMAKEELKRKPVSMGWNRPVPLPSNLFSAASSGVAISTPYPNPYSQPAPGMMLSPSAAVSFAQPMHAGLMTVDSGNTLSASYSFGPGVQYAPLGEEYYIGHGVSRSSHGSSGGMWPMSAPQSHSTAYEPTRNQVPGLVPATGTTSPTNLGSYGSFRPLHPHTSSNHQNQPGIGIYQCPHCPAQFDRAGRYEAHLNGHRDFRPYVCDKSCGVADCTMNFTSAEALGSHKRKDRVKCENCGNLVAKKNLSRHNKAHCPSLF